MSTKPSSKQITFLPSDAPGTPLSDVQTALRAALADMGGGGGDPTAVPIVAVLGDSITDISTARTDSWPQLMERTLNQCGDQVRVVNLAIGGTTFFGARTTTTFGGTTMVAKAIALAPAIVIVQLGYNDVLSGRTYAQIIADAAALATDLRAGLPDATLVFSAERAHDSVNFPTPGTTLKSKGCLPFDFTFTASGLSVGAYSTAMLEVASSAPTKQKVQDLENINTYVATLPQWNGTFVNDYWKVARLGCFMADGLHPTLPGMQLIAHNVLKGLNGLAAVTQLPRFKASASNVLSALNGLFAAYLTQSGDGWVDVAPSPDVDKIAYEMGLTRKINPRSWFYPYRTRFTVQGPSGANAPTHLILENAPPSASVFYSFDGGAFGDSGQDTSPDGYAIITLPPAYVGSSNLIKVGNEVYGPFTVSSLATIEHTAEGNLVLGRGRPAQTTTVDFRSSGLGTYDVRLAATGGTGSGNGTLTVTGNVSLSGSTTVSGTTTFNGNVVINTAGAVNCLTLAAFTGITTSGTVAANGNITSNATISAPSGSFSGLGVGSLSATTAALGRITVDGVYIDTQTTGLGTWIDIAGVAGFIPGIGVAPPTDNAFSLGGSGYRWTSVWATSGVVSTSDATAKKCVKDEQLGLGFVEALRPVSYKWRASKDKGTYHGFIAQEVHEALAGRKFAGLTEPTEPDGLYGLRYSEFIAPLVKAIQELSARIKELETR